MKLFKPTLVAVALVSVLGCQQETKQAEVVEVKLETEQQKQAYSLGASIGMYMERNLAEQEKLGLNLDRELIVTGFLESLEGKSKIEQEEIQTLLMALDQETKVKQQELAEKAAQDSLAEGQKFLEENAKKEGVMVTDSGIQYQILTPAEGEKPAATDTVKVHYKGTFLNGETFDSSYDRGQPAVFPLNRVIRGWTEGVQLMSVGSKYKFTIPSDLAYGPMGNPPRIPGNSVLEFEIELLEIQKPEPVAEVGEHPAS
ncbi:FKBP-type peptidyl-prolyl cis-trans isomerase [Endozoicomonas sp. G2_1]|uniref:FKBP-type peptidyl-prolyl cis-trans isomerase n=1 Tax=Endozoicomonas sp. G2_1 TaxID=2821091 RepID=UPI001ADBDAFA|nr:FKBP-type peptidyl-prolyl cis-trans isomerase [Endozoicomonas sp. G2_1]MBO9491866.1 FKBP-type peptidyl-prolyl cis-trans isomerase [Endozoicomonas sp. G2_1]